MLNWYRDYKRRKLLKNPFPASWLSHIEARMPCYFSLDEAERKRLRDLVQVFVSEKYWEGCGGLELTDEIRVTIAAHACLLVLGLPHDYYRRINSIFVYPSAVVIPQRAPGIFEVPSAPLESSVPVLGVAHMRGPLVLVWDSVLHSARHSRDGHNVVYHEFAHKLDMLSGRADGTPPLEHAEQYRRWIEVCSRVYLELRDRAQAGKKTFLDSYGAVSEAEFFAVSTEQFFEQGAKLKENHPELYQVLSQFYRQDPASRSRVNQ